MILALSALAFAAPPRVIPVGATVQIDDIARKDAFWRFRTELVGMVCVVGDPGLVRHHRKWYGGALTCADGSPYYFYQVSVSVGDYATELAGVLGATEPPTPEPMPLDLSSLFPPSREEAAPLWPVGAPVKIRAISRSDAIYARKPTLVGSECTVADAPLQPSGEEWVSGSLRCGDTEPRFFFQVAVDTRPLPASPQAAGTRLREPTVAAGRRVRVVDVATTDLHAKDRSALVGTVCTVAEAPLLSTGDGWYAGRLFCGEGREYQLYQVAVEPL